jgi:poly-gamma-glutamate capsule biosynthesis protein CapA/YwtB (metallophosphatase superfamily)
VAPSRRVLRRRRQVATGAVTLALILALVLILLLTVPAPGRHRAGRRVPHHQPSGPTTSAPGLGIATRAGQGRASPLDPTWTGDGRAVTIAFGGDVHFEGVLGRRLAENPATALDGSVATLLSGADLSMTNFESALTDGTCPDPQPKTYVFQAPPSAITAFRSAGITLVTEANNHGEDCGRAGLEQSLALAQAAGYPIIGIGQNAAQAFAPYRANINGQRIAIIAATQVLDTNLAAAWTATPSSPGLASAYQEASLVAAVEAARQTADTVIVYLHWGTETDDCPNPIQEPLAEALVKAGADIVLGTHAHVQLGAGYLGSAFVDYGLGNLAFYDTNPPETYSGSLLVTVTGRRIDSFSWRPALIESGLPIPQSGAAASAAITRWTGLRTCTNLAGAPGASTATTSTETTPFAGPDLGTLPDPKDGSPGTTRKAQRATGDS